jgi:soluble lytic murein transglycosylase-like protein
MQLLPSTARWLGPAVLGRRIDPHDLQDNIDGGVAYLAWLQRQAGGTAGALAAYYQGLSALRRHGQFPGTREYVSNVMAHVGRV